MGVQRKGKRQTGLYLVRDLMESIKKVHRVTPGFLYVWIIDPDNPGVPELYPVSHNKVPKYAKFMLEPPKGAAVIGTIDTDTYKGPADVKPLAPGATVPISPPAQGEKVPGAKKPTKPKVAPATTPTVVTPAAISPAPAASGASPDPDKMVPVYNHTDKHVWVFMNQGGVPVITKLLYSAVAKQAHKILNKAPDGTALAGKMDPSTAQSQADVYPVDWVPAGAAAPVPAQPPAPAVAPPAPAPVVPLKPPPKAPPLVPAPKPAAAMAPSVDPETPSVPPPKVQLPAVDTSGDFDWPIPPNFKPYFPGVLPIDAVATPQGVFSGVMGTWRGLKGLENAVYTKFGGEIRSGQTGEILWLWAEAKLKQGTTEWTRIEEIGGVQMPTDFESSSLLDPSIGLWKGMMVALYEHDKKSIYVVGDKHPRWSAPIDATLQYPLPPNFISKDSNPHVAKIPIADGTTLIGIAGLWMANGSAEAVYTVAGAVALLESPGDESVWVAAKHGVAKGKTWTRMKANYMGTPFPPDFNSSVWVAGDGIYLGLWHDLIAFWNANTGEIKAGSGEVLLPAAPAPEAPKAILPWPVPPNFEPKDPDLALNDDDGIFGIWYGAADPYGVDAFFDATNGNVVRPDTGTILWEPGLAGVTQGAGPWVPLTKTADGTPFPPGFDASESSTVSAFKAYLGMISNSDGDYVPAVFNPATGTVFDVGADVVAWTVPAQDKNAAKPAAFEWPYPPSFTSKDDTIEFVTMPKYGSKPAVTVDYMGVRGTWQTTLSAQADVLYTTEGVVRRVSDGRKLWGAPESGISKGTGWSWVEMLAGVMLPPQFDSNYAAFPPDQTIASGMWQGKGPRIPAQFYSKTQEIVDADKNVLWKAGAQATTFPWPLPPSFTPHSLEVTSVKIGDLTFQGLQGVWGNGVGSQANALYDLASGNIRSASHTAVWWRATEAGIEKGAWPSIKDIEGTTFPAQFKPDGKKWMSAASSVTGVWMNGTAKVHARFYREPLSIRSIATNEILWDAAPKQPGAEWLGKTFPWPIPPNFHANSPAVVAVPTTVLKGGVAKTYYGLKGTWHGWSWALGVPAVYTADTGQIFRLDKPNEMWDAEENGFKQGQLEFTKVIAYGSQPLPPAFILIDQGTPSGASPLLLGWWNGSDEPGKESSPKSAYFDPKTGDVHEMGSDTVLWSPKASTIPFDWPVPPNFVPGRNGMLVKDATIGDVVTKGVWGTWHTGIDATAVYTVDGKIYDKYEHLLWDATKEGLVAKGTINFAKTITGEPFPPGFQSSHQFPDSDNEYLGMWSGGAYADSPVAAYYMADKAVVSNAVSAEWVWKFSDALPAGAPKNPAAPDEFDKALNKNKPWGGWAIPPNFVPNDAWPFWESIKLVKGSKGHKKNFKGMKGVWHDAYNKFEAFQDKETGKVIRFGSTPGQQGAVLWSPEEALDLKQHDQVVKTPPVIGGYPIPPNFKASKFNAATASLGMWYATPGSAGIPALLTWAGEIVASGYGGNTLWSKAGVISSPAAPPPEEVVPYTPPPPPPPPKASPGAKNPAIDGLPDPAKLTPVANAPKLGGAGTKEVLQDATGKQFLWKHATAKGTTNQEEFRAVTQEVFATLATMVRAEHLPIKAGTRKGMLGTLQPMIEVAGTLEGTKPADLSEQEKLDVATEHVLDWISSQHDSHSGNLVRTKNGRVISVDKEQGFKYFGADRLDVDYHPNESFGEKEPFYNTFWKDWSSGKVDFDPTALAGVFDTLHASNVGAYEAQLRRYAAVNARLKTPYEREEFVHAALSRRNTAKRDFEKFLTVLYKKRTGQDGKFKFSTGWNNATKKKTYKKITYDFAQWAESAKTEGGNTAHQVYTLQGKETFTIKLRAHTGDPELIVFKIEQSTGLEPLNRFCAENKIPLFGDPIQGSANHMVFVQRAALLALGTVTDQVELPETADLKQHAGQAEYLPAVPAHVAADPNLEFLDQMHKAKNLGYHGRRIFLDTDVVEGQTATVRRVKFEGAMYNQVLFKVRTEFAQKAKGEPGIFKAPAGSYLAVDDAIDMTGGSALLESHVQACRKVTVGQNQLLAFGATGAWSLRGLVLAYVKEPDVLVGLRPLITKMYSADLADRILRTPTPEDRDNLKALRLLNALAPQKHDALLGGSVNAMRAALAKVGGDSLITSVREVDVLDGFMSHVLPGRWREPMGPDGTPVLRYLFHATKDENAVPSVLKGGLAGGNERIFSGAFGFGTSHGGALNSADFTSGGADTVQTRVSTANTYNMPLYIGSVAGSTQFIITPDVVDRLDAILHKSDSYGCMNPSGASGSGNYVGRRPMADAIRNMNDSCSKGSDNHHSWSQDSAEMVLRRGVSSKKIIRVTCGSTALRESVLNACVKANYLEHNGVPIEDFVVVETKQGPVYEKYVKPAGF